MEENRELTSGAQEPLWLFDAALAEFPSLSQPTDADVCIIGGGIAGLTTAYQLACEGKKVAVLEDGRIGSGETGRTSAHLSNALDDRYYTLEEVHGAEGARVAAQSHTIAIERIASIVATESIACEFEWIDGYLIADEKHSDNDLAREREAAHRAGLTDVDWVSRAPWKTFDTGRCLRFPRQAQFHPLRYLQGLAQAVVRRGGRIFEKTHVTQIEGGSQVRVTTRQGPVVLARSAVVATNVPIHQRVAIHLKQAAYRSYVIAAPIPAGNADKALYWDTADPYHYVRLQAGYQGSDPLLIVGGEDHKTGQPPLSPSPFSRLEQWARKRFPSLGGVKYEWSGQIIEPQDGLAFIGHHPLDEENIYLVTGDSGNGLTHGTIAGLLFPDLIQGRSNPWTEIYNPGRVRLKASGEFVKENINVAAQYADWLTQNAHRELASLPPNGAAVIKDGSHHLAAYRNAAGQVSVCSAICPHLGCLVRWNGTEKTWDCPCHGSRFDPEGHVMNGPANSDLPATTAAVVTPP